MKELMSVNRRNALMIRWGLLVTIVFGIFWWIFNLKFGHVPTVFEAGGFPSVVTNFFPFNTSRWFDVFFGPWISLGIYLEYRRRLNPRFSVWDSYFLVWLGAAAFGLFFGFTFGFATTLLVVTGYAIGGSVYTIIKNLPKAGKALCRFFAAKDVQ